MKNHQIICIRKILIRLTGSVICFAFPVLLQAQTNYGYVSRGDSIEFVFGQETNITVGLVHIDLEKRFSEIKQVNVAGDFNAWSPVLPGYQMKPSGKLFKLKVAKASLGKSGETKQFKFVINQKYWIEPPEQAPNRLTGKDHNTNLTLKL